MKPDTTMFIPESTVLVNPTSQLLELKGKALGGMFGGGSKKMFELSSENHDVIKQWIAILGPMAIQQETKVINTPVPVAAADNVDNRSIHSKVLAAEDDNNQAGTSKLDPNAASANENAAHHTNDDTLKQAPAESSENAAAVAAGAGAGTVAAGTAAAATPELNPITNVPSHLVDNETVSTDDDDDFRRQTIEYSTHSPISETPPPTTNVDEHNPFVNMNNHSKDSVDKEGTASSATTSPATPTNASYANNNTTNDDIATGDTKPRGPTREGSELYWDTNTTPLHTTSSYLG